MRGFFKAALFLGGLFLLALLVRQVGWDAIVFNVKRVGWYLWGLVLLAISWHWVNALALAIPLNMRPANAQPDRSRIPFWNVFRAKMVGESLTALTPFMYLGGEPIKAYMLKGDRNVSEIAAALFFDRIAEVVGSVLFGLIGFAIGSALLPTAWQVKAVCLVLLLVMLGATVWFLKSVGQGGASRLYNQLERVKGGKYFRRGLFEKIQFMEITLQQFLVTDRRGVFLALFLHLIGRVLGIFEIFVVCSLVGSPISLTTCTVIASLSMIINFAFAFVPSQMGVAEGGSTFIFRLLGLSTAVGLSVGVVRRIRVIIVILIGLAFYVLPAASEQRVTKA